jgi:hypothetical protein
VTLVASGLEELSCLSFSASSFLFFSASVIEDSLLKNKLNIKINKN